MAGAGSMVGDPYALQASLDNTVREILEMEEQIERQEQEVERLKMLVNESDRFHDIESELERASGLEILNVTNNLLEIRITTYVPSMQAINPNHKDKYEHELTIKLDMTTMAIETVQLNPEDVPYEDLVAEVKSPSRALHEAPLLISGGKGWSRQIPSLIIKFRHRIFANVLKNATLSLVSAKDSRYKLKLLSEANIIIANLPGPVTANIEAPYGWPMPGFTLRLKSLVPSAIPHDLELSGILQQCVDLANSSPESQRSDVLQFLQAIEKIVAAKRREASN